MCFSVSRSTPSSTLFPYTTLFRSCGGSATSPPGRTQSTGFETSEDRDADTLPGSGEGDGAAVPHGSDRGRSPRADRRIPRDRKSTRLNSSHSSISYAVFCLKKKKI